MKATGIVRRIDDLGRIVIPKEIRRTLRLREGTPLEIYTDAEGGIVLKKYSPMEDLGTFARKYADALAQATGHMVCIMDRDQIIAAAGGAKKEIQGKQISKQMESVISNRTVILPGSGGGQKNVSIAAGELGEYTSMVVYPIICEGDAIGAVSLMSRDSRKKMGEAEQKLAAAAAGFLGKQMES